MAKCRRQSMMMMTALHFYTAETFDVGFVRDTGCGRDLVATSLVSEDLVPDSMYDRNGIANVNVNASLKYFKSRCAIS